MAEKIKIADIDINYDAAVQDTLRLTQEVTRLTKAIEESTDEQGNATAETVKYQAELQGTKTELRQNKKFITDVTTAQNANTGSIKQMRAQLTSVTKEWIALSEEERNNTDRGKALTKQKTKLTETLKKEERATGDATRNVGNYNEGLAAQSQALSGVSPQFASASGAAKSFGTILKVALGPIGLVIAAIGALVTYFKRSEDGQNNLVKITKIFNVVLNNLLDVVSAVGEGIFNAITKPQESWQKFKDLLTGIGDYFENTFGNIIMGTLQGTAANFNKFVANIQLGWEKLVDVFSDNADGIKGAQDKIAEAQNKLDAANERVELGMKNTTDSIKNGYDAATKSLKEFTAETQKEIDIAIHLANLQANLDKRERENLVKTAKERLQIERLKNEIEDKNNKTAEERIILIDQQNAILDEQINRTLSLAQTRLKIKEEENKLSLSTKEDLAEEAQLRADLYVLEAEVESKRREAITKRQEAERQIVAEAKAILDKSIADQKVIEDAKTEKEKDERQRQLEQKALDYENELALYEGNINKTYDLLLEGLEAERIAELEYAEKIGADTQKVKEKYNKIEQSLEREKLNAKFDLIGEFADNISTLFGEETKVGKAAAIVSTTISTLQGAAGAFAKTSAAIPAPAGLIAGGIAAGAVVANGVAAVRKITSVDTNVKSGTATSSPIASAKPNIPAIDVRNINTEIGQGIVTRGTATGGIAKEAPQNVLVIDKVTQAQNIESEKLNISTI